MSHFKYLILVISIILFFTDCKKKTQTKEPNILLICVDDLRTELGCYGASYIKSPNIDQLGAESVIFNRAYCNIPVCGASRASFLTGIRPTYRKFKDYNSRADVDYPNAITITKHLKNHGYKTISLGKVSHDINDNSADWDLLWRPKTNTPHDFILDQNVKLDTLAGKRGYYFENPGMVADSAYFDGKLALKAIETLEKLNKQEKPFFMAVGFIKPHLPFTAPQKYWNMYKKSSIKLPVAEFLPTNAPQRAFHASNELRQYSGIYKGVIKDSTSYNLIHGYYACVSYMDAQVGKLIHKLKELKIYENTTIILWGDHGWNLRDHGMWCKQCNFETSLHAPLIIKSSDIKAGKRDQISEYVDVYPTICDIVGIEKPDQLEGKSLIDILHNPYAKSDEVAISVWQQGVTTIHNNYFYTEWINENDSVIDSMMYDHNLDTSELNNIVANPVITNIRDSLGLIQRKYRGNDFMK